MKLVTKIFDKDTPSILLVTIAYFALHWVNIYQSHFYESIKMIAYLFLLILIQFLFFSIYKSQNKFLKFSAIFFFTTFILLWNGVHIVNLMNSWQIEKFKFQIIRARFFLMLWFTLLLLLEYFIMLKKPALIYAQNIFFAILSIISFIFAFQNNIPTKDIHYFNNKYLPIKAIDTNTKPIILIISDEYNSPDGLVKIFKDSNLYNFSIGLKKKGWLIKNSFYSSELSTIHSLSSLFNFNLSNGEVYSSMSVDEIGSERLMKAELSDSLSKKNIDILNYGIFDIGNSKPITRLYYYPKNLFEVIISNSILPSLFYNTNGLKLSGLKSSFFPMELHNKIIFNTLIDTLKSNYKPNKFVYVHLYMPHSPMLYEPTFKFNKYKEFTLENYLDYWKFTNSKLIPLLDSVNKLNKFRIILAGDHGFRGSKNNIDPHYTFCAFYGFNEIDVNKIYSVQDLGSLIYAYLKTP